MALISAIVHTPNLINTIQKQLFFGHDCVYRFCPNVEMAKERENYEYNGYKAVLLTCLLTDTSQTVTYP